MKSLAVGSSGLIVSQVGLGCNNIGDKLDIPASREVVLAALDHGITLFDTADYYGRGASESALGLALEGRRNEVVIATKFGMPMGADKRIQTSRRYLMSAAEASLKRLRTDRIDLYQIHRPDGVTPIEETLRGLEDLVTQGKVLYLGCSHFPAWMVVDAQWTARQGGHHILAAVQAEYSLLNRSVETELLPALKSQGIGLLPFYPLASGMLTGKYKPGNPIPEGSRMERKVFADRHLNDRNLDVSQRLEGFAIDRGHTLVELAFSWLARNPLVSSVIAGATSASQVKQNAAAPSWELSNDEVAQIDAITLGR